jgi:hypothetical protein
MTSNGLSLLRMIVLGATGLICLAYAVLALINGRPDPFNPYIPGGMGVLAFVAIFFGAMAAGEKNTQMAMDEGYRADARNAASKAYWVAMVLYPIFAVPLAFKMIEPMVAFAAMGPITAAAFLLGFVYLDMKGRL